MPQSRARTAICSAPLEWPSRPGLPTSSLMRRPSRADTRSTSPRTSSRPTTEAATPPEMPVGARYSPNTERSVVPHSPVVTPALAQAIDGSMTLRPSRAALSSSASAFFTALASRPARQAARRSTCSCSMAGSTASMEPSPVESGEASVSVQRLTPTTICSPDSMRRTRSVLLSTSACFM